MNKEKILTWWKAIDHSYMKLNGRHTILLIFLKGYTLDKKGSFYGLWLTSVKNWKWLNEDNDDKTYNFKKW